MRFLLPVGGIVDRRFGILTTPGHKGIPIGIVEGMDWAADNQAFTKGFDPVTFFEWLASMEQYRATCLFVPVPDVVGDAGLTLTYFGLWRYRFVDWPVAFVAQDGQEHLSFPDPALWDTLFIGGSTFWKLTDGAAACIKRAQTLGKRIHVGRVNWAERYDHFAAFEGSEEWTCDGTRTRYDGTRRTVEAWAEYMAAPRRPVEAVQIRLPVFDGHHSG